MASQVQLCVKVFIIIKILNEKSNRVEMFAQSRDGGEEKGVEEKNVRLDA